MQRGKCQPAARRISGERNSPMIEPIGKPAVRFDRILNRSRKRVFRSETVIEVQRANACRGSYAPQKVAVKRG